ncbi:hypothetical protein GA0074696_5997 [Micromonospora purpureochromogenes]|uniref:Uncharacterized protein n=1 Tax=Micromonospora purpureochromogenes TaxID=47872 RepID=A0A1C5AH42_9ACTN|nr:hypothetical protein [Micromonospora purpureochromogenes]SCF44436.1 hypothetical protein GA0074696_5997 [Micromonospora purpureochromogenes]
MARVDVRPGWRALAWRTSSLVAASLATGLAVALAAAPGLATASPTALRVATAATDATTPGGEPTDETTPPVEPTTTEPLPTTAPPTLPPDPTTPAPEPTTATPTTTAPGDPAPTTTAPTTTAPAPPPQGGGDRPVPPGNPAPSQQDTGGLGVRVTTRDIVLGPGYWNARSTTTTLRVTVANTGTLAERVHLAYTLPVGLTDAGTPGCAAVGGGNWRCGEWSAAPGAKFTSLIRVRVDGGAWRRMPLSGSVRVTASGPGTATAADNEGFAVLFPPGPPVSGMSLDADEVAFDISGGPAELGVRLGNTGRVDAAGRIEVSLPDGVSVLATPGCEVVSPTRTRCDVGAVAAGRTATLRLPVAATPQAQREAPLAGAVIAQLDPRSGRTRQMQMTFRITAAAALATPPAATPVPTGSQGVIAAAGQTSDGGAMSSAQRIAVTLIAVSGLLVVLALTLATTSLRRRLSGPVPDPSANPASD